MPSTATPRSSRLFHGVIIVALGVSAGCGPASDAENRELRSRGADVTSERLEAELHPEACVLTMYPSGDACSGALIAPNVVLTAGHCVAFQTSWEVTCPYASDRRTVRASVGSIPANYPGTPDLMVYFNNGSDVGLIRLDEPLRETRVGRVRLTPIEAGTQALVIGRIHHNQVTNRLYVSPAQTLSLTDRANGYWAAIDHKVIQPGDSGGPVEDPFTREIVAVTSAYLTSCQAGQPCDYFSTLSAAAEWFQSTYAAYAERAPTNNLVAAQDAQGRRPAGDPIAIQ